MRGAFSILELILILLILSTLSYMAITRLSPQKRLCMIELRVKLQEANSRLLETYMSKIKNADFDISPQTIISSLTNNPKPNCNFSLKNKSLYAKIGSETLKFDIFPQDLATKPKISCRLSNKLCMEFEGKKLDK